MCGGQYLTEDKKAFLRICYTISFDCKEDSWLLKTHRLIF